MIPDKIYTDNRGGYAKIPIFSQADANIEYIRKDALLEWAKGEIMPGNSAEGKGWNWALQTLIEKIETL